MKNKSWKYPFPTFSDKMFDGNKDGKLDAFETMFRDMHIEEMARKAAKQDTKPKSSCYIPKTPAEKTVYNGTKITERKNNVNTTPIGVQLVFILLAVAALVGGFIMALSTEGTMFIKAIILFGAAAIAIGLLKFAGVYK
ncbi:MAG: rod-binding protein [Clostridia bacterium]|nr:rod-binding protein [Clostridia bacterium]